MATKKTSSSRSERARNVARDSHGRFTSTTHKKSDSMPSSSKGSKSDSWEEYGTTSMGRSKNKK